MATNGKSVALTMDAGTEQKVTKKPNVEAVAGVKNVLSNDVPEPMKLSLGAIERKIRNLEKRKNKLEAYCTMQAQGKDLSSEQISAMQNFSSVVATLEFAHEFYNQMMSYAKDFDKEQKKQKRMEKKLKVQAETVKIREVLVIQDILSRIFIEPARTHFLMGECGAVKIAEKDFEMLEKFYADVTTQRPKSEHDVPFVTSAQKVAEYLSITIDGRPKSYGETTLEHLFKIIKEIELSGYFDKLQCSDSDATDADEEIKCSFAKGAEPIETSLDEGIESLNLSASSQTDNTILPAAKTEEVQVNQVQNVSTLVENISYSAVVVRGISPELMVDTTNAANKNELTKHTEEAINLQESENKEKLAETAAANMNLTKPTNQLKVCSNAKDAIINSLEPINIIKSNPKTTESTQNLKVSNNKVKACTKAGPSKSVSVTKKKKCQSKSKTVPNKEMKVQVTGTTMYFSPLSNEINTEAVEESINLSESSNEMNIEVTAAPLNPPDLSNEISVKATAASVNLPNVSTEVNVKPTAAPINLPNVSTEAKVTPTAAPINLPNVSTEVNVKPTATRLNLPDLSDEMYVRVATAPIILPGLSKINVKATAASMNPQQPNSNVRQRLTHSIQFNPPMCPITLDMCSGNYSFLQESELDLPDTDFSFDCICAATNTNSKQQQATSSNDKEFSKSELLSISNIQAQHEFLLESIAKTCERRKKMKAEMAATATAVAADGLTANEAECTNLANKRNAENKLSSSRPVVALPLSQCEVSSTNLASSILTNDHPNKENAEFLPIPVKDGSLSFDEMRFLQGASQSNLGDKQRISAVIDSGVDNNRYIAAGNQSQIDKGVKRDAGAADHHYIGAEDKSQIVGAVIRSSVVADNRYIAGADQCEIDNSVNCNNVAGNQWTVVGGTKRNSGKAADIRYRSREHQLQIDKGVKLNIGVGKTHAIDVGDKLQSDKSVKHNSAVGKNRTAVVGNKRQIVEVGIVGDQCQIDKSIKNNDGVGNHGTTEGVDKRKILGGINADKNCVIDVGDKSQKIEAIKRNSDLGTIRMFDGEDKRRIVGGVKRDGSLDKSRFIDAENKSQNVEGIKHDSGLGEIRRRYSAGDKQNVKEDYRSQKYSSGAEAKDDAKNKRKLNLPK